MEVLNKVRVGFDKVPTPVKIIFYSGLSLLVAKATYDIGTLDGWYVEYLAIVAGVITNLVAWKLLSLKEDK